MTTPIPSAVRKQVRFANLHQMDEVFAKKFLNSVEKRRAAIKAVLKNVGDFLGTDAREALYMAEKQSQGLFDYFHFSAIYLAETENDFSGDKNLMKIFLTIQAERPRYLVENWRAAIINAVR